LDEGIKDKRKYCSPLEALLWIGYDREFNDADIIDDDNFSFKNFSIDKLIEEGWSYTKESNGSTWERSKKSGSANDKAGNLENMIWRIYNAKPNFYKSDRWKNFDDVIDRVSSPTLLIEYLNNNFKNSFSPAEIGLVNEKNSFEYGGACVQYSTLATYCLEKASYEAYSLVVTFDKLLMGGYGHVICIYKDKNENNDLYSWVDNYNPILYRIGFKRPVEHLLIDDILDKLAYQRKVGFTSVVLYDSRGKIVRTIPNGSRISTVVPKDISPSDSLLRFAIPYITQ